MSTENNCPVCDCYRDDPIERGLTRLAEAVENASFNHNEAPDIAQLSFALNRLCIAMERSANTEGRERRRASERLAVAIERATSLAVRAWRTPDGACDEWMDIWRDAQAMRHRGDDAKD